MNACLVIRKLLRNFLFRYAMIFGKFDEPESFGAFELSKIINSKMDGRTSSSSYSDAPAAPDRRPDLITLEIF